jgi:hypothetical protein
MVIDPVVSTACNTIYVSDPDWTINTSWFLTEHPIISITPSGYTNLNTLLAITELSQRRVIQLHAQARRNAVAQLPMRWAAFISRYFGLGWVLNILLCRIVRAYWLMWLGPFGRQMKNVTWSGQVAGADADKISILILADRSGLSCDMDGSDVPANGYR